MTRTMGLLIALATLACGDSTGPPDPPEFFITTDSLSYTLKEIDIPDIFFFDLVLHFTNPLPDTLHFLSCGPGPFPDFEHLSDGVFTRSEIAPGCAIAFIGERALPPGAVTTDTLRWIIGRSSPTSAEQFAREIPGTFRAVFVVWDSLGEAPLTGREIAKELRVSAPFDILLAPGTGG